MSIAFDTIPVGSRIPFTFVEISTDGAVQGPQIQPYAVMLIGQKLDSGSEPALTPTVLVSPEQAGALFGLGSQIHTMATALFANVRNVEVRAIAQEDPPGSSQATSTVTITGEVTSNGSVFLYVGGSRYVANVSNGDSATAVAASIVAAIASDPGAVVTAANVAGVVTLTVKNAGSLGNSIDVRLNYNEGERTTGGIEVALTAMAGGAGEPDYDALWDPLSNEAANIYVLGNTSQANLTSLDTELDSQFGPISQKGVVAFCGRDATHAELLSLGDSQNSRHLSIVGVENSLSTEWAWAAAFAAQVATNGRIDPARPFQTLPLRGIVPPPAADAFTFTERDLLLHDGITTWVLGAGNLPRIERVITTYQENAVGAADPSLLDVNTLLTLDYLRFDLRADVQLRFPRHKVKGDNGVIPVGQPILTPSTFRGFIVGKFRQWEGLGLVEDAEQFIEDLAVEVNVQNPNRLDVLLSPNLVNQLRQTASQIAFLL